MSAGKSGVTGRGLARAARNLSGAFLLLAGIALLVVIVGWKTPFWWSLLCPLLFAAGLALLGVAAPVLLTWLVYVAGFLLFVRVRLIADDLAPIDVRYDYVIELDRLIGAGHVPSIALQRWLYRLGHPSPLILAMVAVYLSYFVVPHVVAVIVWLRRSLGVFRRYVAASLVCYYVGVAIAVILPTAPPWIAGQTGHSAHVYRVVYDVLVGARPEAYVQPYPLVDGNSFAAMPSLHMAIAVISALGLGLLGRTAGRIGIVYACLMGIALVLTGEHYAIDVLAGLAVALVVWKLVASPGLSAPAP